MTIFFIFLFALLNFNLYFDFVNTRQLFLIETGYNTNKNFDISGYILLVISFINFISYIFYIFQICIIYFYTTYI